MKKIYIFSLALIIGIILPPPTAADPIISEDVWSIVNVETLADRLFEICGTLDLNVRPQFFYEILIKLHEKKEGTTTLKYGQLLQHMFKDRLFFQQQLHHLQFNFMILIFSGILFSYDPRFSPQEVIELRRGTFRIIINNSELWKQKSLSIVLTKTEFYNEYIIPCLEYIVDELQKNSKTSPQAAEMYNIVSSVQDILLSDERIMYGVLAGAGLLGGTIGYVGSTKVSTILLPKKNQKVYKALITLGTACVMGGLVYRYTAYSSN